MLDAAAALYNTALRRPQPPFFEITPHPSAARLPPPPCSSSWAAKPAVAAVTTLFAALTSANTDLHPCGLLPEAKPPQR